MLGVAICAQEPAEFDRMMAAGTGLSLVVREDGEPVNWRLHALLREFLAERILGARRKMLRV